MATLSTASKPTSLKLPAALKTQLEQEAQRAGLSLHAFMVATLADSVRRTGLRDAWAQDSMNALSDMTASGSGHKLGADCTHSPPAGIWRLAACALMRPE
jgi:hypothetical protein